MNYFFWSWRNKRFNVRSNWIHYRRLNTCWHWVNNFLFRWLCWCYIRLWIRHRLLFKLSLLLNWTKYNWYLRSCFNRRHWCNIFVMWLTLSLLLLYSSGNFWKTLNIRIKYIFPFLLSLLTSNRFYNLNDSRSLHRSSISWFIF